MPNFASSLRDEIRRLARKELRSQLEPIAKRGTEQRKAIAELRRQVAALERKVQFLEGRERGRLKSTPAPTAAPEGVRFSPKWVRADRARLGLSAREYALLVGVSTLTIYNWEHGKSRPQAKPLAAWAEIRGIGKREALKRLDLLEK